MKKTVEIPQLQPIEKIVVTPDDPFVEVKASITDLITRLQTESSSETTVKSYCDEEVANSAVKKEDIGAEVAKHSSVKLKSFKLETAVCEVAELHADLSDWSHQLNIDPMRVDDGRPLRISTWRPKEMSILPWRRSQMCSRRRRPSQDRMLRTGWTSGSMESGSGTVASIKQRKRRKKEKRLMRT